MKFKLLISLAVLCSWNTISFAQSPESESRTWTDSTGKHKIVGSFVEVDGDIVVLSASDGTKKRIAIKKLSASDQQFIKENRKDNPFNQLESESSKSIVDNQSPTKWSMTPKIDWDNVPHVDFIEPMPWKVSLPSVPKLDIDANRILSASKRIEMFGPVELLVDIPTKRLFVFNQGAKDPIRRISIIGMNDGSLQNTDVVQAAMSPVAMIPGSSSVVMIGSDVSSDVTRTTKAIEIWDIQGKKIRRSGVWLPFEKDPNVRSANDHNELQFVDVLPSGQLLALSKGGHLAAWDIRTQKPIWHSQLDARCCVAFAPDKSLMAVLDGSKLVVLDPATGRLQGLQTLDLDAPSQVNHKKYELAWSGDGKRLFLLTGGVDFAGRRMLVFDAMSGELVKSVFDMPSNLFGREFGRDSFVFNMQFRSKAPDAHLFLQSANSDFVLIGEEVLFHIPTQLAVCEYLGSERVLFAGGFAFILRCQYKDHRGTISALQLPHDKAIEALNESQKNPDFVLFKPGSEVEINTDRIPQEYRNQVYEKIAKRMASKKISVVQSAKTRIEAEFSVPRSIRIAIPGSEKQTFNELECTLVIKRGTTRLWQASTTNYPQIRPNNFGMPTRETIAKQNGKPPLDFFDTVELPMYLIRDVLRNPVHSREVLLRAEFSDAGGIK